MKKYFSFFLLISVVLLSNTSIATPLNFDNIMIGLISNYHVSNEKYYFDFSEEEDAPDSYTFTGNIDDNIDKQVKKTLKEISRNKQKKVAIKFSMNSPVAIQSVNESQLYIQPSPVQKSDHAIVGVCIPETDDCWKMKILKGNPQYAEITTSLQGNEVTAYYTEENELLTYYVNTELNQINYEAPVAIQTQNKISSQIVYPEKLSRLFKAGTINTTVEYFNKEYGPAKEDFGISRVYDIDGCIVETSGEKTIESITLHLTPQCTVDMSQFTNHGTSAYGMTFGDFERDDLPLEYEAHCFKGSCGNSLDPWVDGHTMLSRAQDFLEIKVSSKYDGKPRTDFDKAYEKFGKEIEKIRDDEWLATNTDYCGNDISNLIKHNFSEVSLSTITIGYNLSDEPCQDYKPDIKNTQYSDYNQQYKQEIFSEKGIPFTVYGATLGMKFSDWVEIFNKINKNNNYKIKTKDTLKVRDIEMEYDLGETHIQDKYGVPIINIHETDGIIDIIDFHYGCLYEIAKEHKNDIKSKTKAFDISFEKIINSINKYSIKTFGTEAKIKRGKVDKDIAFIEILTEDTILNCSIDKDYNLGGCGIFLKK